MTVNKGDKILVTGGTGVIGAWVVRAALQAGLVPVIATRGITNSANHLLDDVEGYESLSIDIQDADSVESAVGSVSPAAIVHLASSKPWQIEPESRGGANPIEGARNIVMGTINLLDAAHRHRVPRFVYASSKSVYEPFGQAYGFPEFAPVPESYPCNPMTLYGIDKRAAELHGNLYRTKLGLDFAAVRFGTTYGPFKRGDGNHPALLLGRAARGEPIRIEINEQGLLRDKDDLIFNEDVARGIVQCLLRSRSNHWVYNLGTARGHTFQEILDLIQAVTGHHDIVVEVSDRFVPSPADAYMKQNAGVLDISAARADFDFAPRTIESGFAITTAIERSGTLANIA